MRSVLVRVRGKLFDDRTVKNDEKLHGYDMVNGLEDLNRTNSKESYKRKTRARPLYSLNHLPIPKFNATAIFNVNIHHHRAPTFFLLNGYTSLEIKFCAVWTTAALSWRVENE